MELKNVNFPVNIRWQQSINFSEWPSMILFLSQVPFGRLLYILFCTCIFISGVIYWYKLLILYLFILYVVVLIDNATYVQKYLHNTKRTTRVANNKKEILKAETYHWHATEEANRYGVISSLELYVVFANDVHIAQPHLPTQSWCPHRKEHLLWSLSDFI